MRKTCLSGVLAVTTLLTVTGLSRAGQGRITQWLLAGPFQEGGKPAEFLTADPLGKPAALAPSDGAVAGNKKWVKHATPTGFINVNDKDVPVGTTKRAAFAAFVYVYSPKVQPAKLTLTFSNGLVACLNGREVFNQPDGGRNTADGFKTDALLGKGWNRLYVKCAWFARFRATWSFGARLTAPDMADLDGVKLAVRNPYRGGKIEAPKYVPFIHAYTVEHFGIHRVLLKNISPLDLPGAKLVVRGKAGKTLQTNDLGTLKAFSQTEVDIDTDEVSFQQNWPGAVAEVRYDGGKVSAPLAPLKIEGAQVVEYETPHLQRMKPWATGRVKILLLVRGSNRQTIELVQRGDFEWHLVDTAGKTAELDKQLKQELANNTFDCIVAAAQSWKKMPALGEIQAAVKKGTGLVVVTPTDLPEAMDKLLGLEGSAAVAKQRTRAGKIEPGAWKSPAAAGAKAESKGAEAARLSHTILVGEFLPALPPVGPAPLKTAKGADVIAKVGNAPVVIAREAKAYVTRLRGAKPYRTVVLNFGRGSSLIWPIARGQFLDNYRLPVWERQWSLVLKSILWAAKKDGGVKVFCETAKTWTRDAGKPPGVGVDVFGAADKSAVKAEPTVRGHGYDARALGAVSFSKVAAGLAGGRPLPTDLPAGENEINVVLRDADGKVLWWANTVLTVQPRGSVGKIAVKPDEKERDYFKPGDEIAFTVPGKADADGLTLTGRLLDNHGRCVAAKQVQVKKGDFSEKFTFKADGLLTTVGRFQAELAGGDLSLASVPKFVEARGEAIFFVRHAFVWDKYEPVLWLTRSGANWYYDLDYFRLLNDVMWIPNGWSTWYNPNGPHRAMVVNAGLEGVGMESLHFFSMNHNWTRATFEMRRNKFKQTKDIRWLRRTPIDKATGVPMDSDKIDYDKLPFGNNPHNSFFPLDDPKYLAFTRRKIAAQIKRVRRYNPLTYDLMDEGSHTSYARAFDFDFSSVSIANFRKWLQTQYVTPGVGKPDLKALNAEWNTEFKTWDEVMPMHTQQVRAHARGKKLPSYGPWVDHRKYNDIVYNKYIQVCGEAARAGGDDDAYVGIGGGQRPNPYGGWDYWLVTNHFSWIENYFQDTTEYIRSFNTPDRKCKACPGADVWWSVKLGNVGFYRWVDYGHIRGDFSLLPRGRDTAKQLEEVRGRGFSKLLYKAEATDEPIGIHYSQSTIQLSYIRGGRGAADQYGNGGPLLAKLGFYHLIEELGYQYKFVSYAQVEAGHLQQAKYKVMILPESAALSNSEAANLKEWVTNGGVLVADRWVGEWTAHGRKRDKSVMEQYFGMDPAKAADKRVGKGWVIYLAGDWPVRYWTDRQGKDVKPFWDKMSDALAKAGIKGPRARMLTADGAPARRTEIRYFDLGKIRYHVISADVPGKYTFASNTGIPAGGVHVYDMRDGRYGGPVGKIEVSTTAPFPALVATARYKIEGVTAKADRAEVKGGEAVTIAAAVKVALVKPLDADSIHALHFRVYGPDGVERRWYADTVFGKAGKAALTIKTALNEAAGKWTVKVADLASGAEGQATFKVK